VAGLNGVLWEGKHLRADRADGGARDYKRCVFVGNLPFEVQDEALWGHFERCGEIEFVRVVRDKKTNLGKGFGYVQFKVLTPSPLAHGHLLDGFFLDWWLIGRSVNRWRRLCC
jgi:nucleolar protein 12